MSNKTSNIILIVSILILLYAAYNTGYDFGVDEGLSQKVRCEIIPPLHPDSSGEYNSFLLEASFHAASWHKEGHVIVRIPADTLAIPSRYRDVIQIGDYHFRR